MDNPADTVVLLFTNAPDEAVAERIAQAVVQAKLAACVNVGAAMRSVYRWEGEVESASEIPMWIKTTASRQDELMRAIAALHPYDVPEMLVLPINQGLPAYLDWVRQETRR